MEALLGYLSDSSGAGSEGEEPPLKRARPEAARPAPPLLPPADALLDGSYSPPPAAAQRALERAVLHQGRERAFPHVTGNFATHVYIEVPTPSSCLGTLQELLQLLQAQLPDLQPVVHAPSSSNSSSSSSSVATDKPPRQRQAAAPAASLPAAGAAPASAAGSVQAAAAGGRPARLAQPLYHVSLSRTVPLRLDQIQPLVDELRRRLRQRDTFQIQLARLVVFCNDARTRTFLAVAAEEAGCSSGGSKLEGGSAAGPLGGAPAQAAEHPNGGGSGDRDSSSGLSSSSELEGGGKDSNWAAGNGAAASTELGRLQRPNYCRQLVQMCHAVSGVFAAHGLPRFYADPQPHASIAWLLGDRQQQLEAALEAPAARAVAHRLAGMSWQLRPAAVVCKAGQRENVVWPATSS
ncbi:U6 snRNA phosphodiesterase [Chlorella sorokiniana]|uniref:U6 snRNA phosphodiesterase 1 n=1 Tax=Chlorella sorokiniana TaxID=3076 RepID=A0A2P6TJ43_CHLSO|nr:U6 snRNA phosphodiesterase [Chlorella sorokiniana]|eukprot:PRW39260.1 U6 snRNA phosphodiesterase [Chlorella sorokiniana]